MWETTNLNWWVCQISSINSSSNSSISLGQTEVFSVGETEKSGHIEVLMNDKVMFFVKLYNKMIVYN